MPASELSFHVTDAYRAQLQGLRDTWTAFARNNWSRVGADLQFDRETWLRAMVPAVTLAQRQARQASSAYLAAFLASETDSPTEATPLLDRASPGTGRDGRPLADVLASALTAVAVSEDNYANALRAGQRRATLLVGLEIDAAAQVPLLETIDADDRFDGFQRAVRGTCGACMAAATGPDGGLHFPRHPHCQCVSEPRVSGVRDRFPRPTGSDLFAAMTEEQQDEALGPAAAEKVRSGIPLVALIQVAKQESTDDFIKQAPAEAL